MNIFNKALQWLKNKHEVPAIDEAALRHSSLLMRLETLAIEDPVDIDDTEEILRLLAESVCYLIPALDTDDIHFDKQQSQAAFYQMLRVSYELTRQPTSAETRH